MTSGIWKRGPKGTTGWSGTNRKPEKVDRGLETEFGDWSIPVNNNDILRRIRYVFDFSDPEMVALFGLADHQVTVEQISAWLKRD